MEGNGAKYKTCSNPACRIPTRQSRTPFRVPPSVSALARRSRGWAGAPVAPHPCPSSFASGQIGPGERPWSLLMFRPAGRRAVTDHITQYGPRVPDQRARSGRVALAPRGSRSFGKPRHRIGGSTDQHPELPISNIIGLGPCALRRRVGTNATGLLEWITRTAREWMQAWLTFFDEIGWDNRIILKIIAKKSGAPEVSGTPVVIGRRRISSPAVAAPGHCRHRTPVRLADRSETRPQVRW